MAGIVRSAMANPPGPVVSCPSTPCLSGTSSSTARAASCPGRIAEKTNRAPAIGRAGVGLAADREPRAPLRAQVPAERRHQLQALGVGVVQHDLVQPEVGPDSAASPRSTNGARTPDPSIVSFMTETLALVLPADMRESRPADGRR